ncbi:MAG: type II secretion system F family protein [Planctomycetota bacterium]
MKTFQYKSKNQQGRAIAGVIEAENETEAVSELRRRGLTVTAISVRKGGSSNSAGSSLFRIGRGSSGGKRRATGRIRSIDIAVMSRQLSTMVAAGIPILEALEVLSDQNENPQLSEVLGEVAADVRAGKDLSAATARHPKVFSDIFVNMIQAGEASGQLDIVLSRLADYMEEAETLRSEVKSAMTYPVISLFIVTGISVFLLVGVIPQFSDMFSTMKVELPALTQFVLGLSNSLRESLGLWALGFAAMITCLALFLRTERGQWVRDACLLKIPVFGPLFVKVSISRFARTFATLISSGVPILGSLEIVQRTAGNRLYADAITRASESVRAGDTLGEPMAKTGMFPPMVTRMIGIGERSGSLEQLLEKIADFYDQQVRSTLKALTSLIEPIMITTIGVIVGGMVLAIFLPIFKMIGSINK